MGGRVCDCDVSPLSGDVRGDSEADELTQITGDSVGVAGVDNAFCVSVPRVVATVDIELLAASTH